MATQRADFAGTGRFWINGTLFSEAAEISVKFGGKLNRQVTLGYSGETREDAGLVTADIKGQMLRNQSMVARLKRYIREDVDVRIKLQVGNDVTKAVGKVGDGSVDTQQGKSAFSFSFSGDDEAV